MQKKVAVITLIIMCFAVLFSIALFIVCKFYFAKTIKTGSVSCIKSGTNKSVDSVLSPHGSDTTYVQVGSRKYEHVRGTDPFLLDVPNSSFALFVMDSHNDRRVYIGIVDRPNCTVRLIDGEETSIGWDFGGKSDPAAAWSEYIRSYEAGHLVICKNAGKTRVCIEVDVDLAGR